MKIRFWDTGNFSKRTGKNYTTLTVIAEIGSFALDGIPSGRKDHSFKA